jgi:hypothetical protein
MPTHPHGRDQQQDPIRLKNLVSEAKNQLSEQRLRRPEIDALLKPVEALLIDGPFWQHQSHGLALFIGSGYFKAINLHTKFEELVVVGKRFHIKPLLPGLSQDQYFYILAFSQNEVRLFHGDRFSVAEVDLEGIPTSLEELGDEGAQRQVQFHTRSDSPGVVGSRAAVYHGHGDAGDSRKIDLVRFFQTVDRGIMNLIGNERIPMVLAGVEYLVPIYKSVSEYPTLVEQGIEGNPDETSPETLHKAGWKLVEPIFQRDRREALERFQMLAGSGSPMTSDRLPEIVQAAYEGRVEILFFEYRTQVWGSFDEIEQKVGIHPKYRPGDQDLLDLAVVQTLVNGGTVYALEPELMPARAELAAIFRYAYAN